MRHGHHHHVNPQNIVSTLNGGPLHNGQRPLGFPTQETSAYSLSERYVLIVMNVYYNMMFMNYVNLQAVSSGVKEFVETADSTGLDSNRGNR